VKSGGPFVDNLRATAAAMGYRADDRLLPVMPFCHFYGLSILFIWWLRPMRQSFSPITGG